MSANLLGRTVTLDDGRVGRVVAEWREWELDDGRHEGHRLRVEITTRMCPECPHINRTVTNYVTADAESVTPT